MPTQQNQPHKLKAKIFYALSDPTRIEILEFLRDGEKCVCQIVPHLGLIQPVVSRHLKILKDAGVVLYRKDGTRRLYTITDPAIYQILDSVTPQLANTLVQKIIEQIPC